MTASRAHAMWCKTNNAFPKTLKVVSPRQAGLSHTAHSAQQPPAHTRTELFAAAACGSLLWLMLASELDTARAAAAAAAGCCY